MVKPSLEMQATLGVGSYARREIERLEKMLKKLEQRIKKLETK